MNDISHHSANQRQARWRLGLDPGKQTGWARFLDEEMMDSGSIGGGLEGFMDWWDTGAGGPVGAGLHVICERFVPEVGLGGADQAWSLEIQGAVKLLARQNGFDLTLQLRSDKAALFGQEEVGDKGATERRAWLAERGLTFETDHAMDAATHVLVERKRARDMLFWKRYWARPISAEDEADFPRMPW